MRNNLFASALTALCFGIGCAISQADALDRATAPNTAAKEETVTGTIVAVEKDVPRLVVGTAEGTMIQLQIEMKAVIRRDGSPVEARDLRPGDRVVAKYRIRDGANIAYSISVSRE